MCSTRLLLLLSLTVGAGLANVRDGCNVATAIVSGVGTTCAAIGGLLCAVTFGIGCAVSVGCGVGATAGATLGKEVCSLGKDDESGGGFSSEQLRSLTEKMLETEYRLENKIEEIEDNVLESELRLGQEITQLNRETKDLITQLNRETKDLIRRRSQMVLDSLKEVDKNLTKLATQMDNARLELAKTIDLGSLQTSYHEDLEHYDLFERKFKDLERDASGLIMNNEDVEIFKRVVNDHFRGAEQTFVNFHSMMVGNDRLSQKSIFETDSSFCKSKDYFLYVMMKLFQFDAIAKAMDGEELDSVLTQTFTKMIINVQQKHIQICGCQSKQFPKQISNLQTLVSQPSPNTSVGEFYTHMIWDNSLNELDLKKLNRVYTVKPFDLSPDIVKAIKSNPMEAVEIVHNLASRDSLHILPLLENTTLCTAEATFSAARAFSGQTTQLMTPAQEKGVITSPNFPGKYPNSLRKTDTIRTKEGMVVKLEFTTFDLPSDYDRLTIRDGDETILMAARGGNDLPHKIWSQTNIVHLDFVTNGYNTRTGWSANWTAVENVCPASWTFLGPGCYMFLEGRMNWYMAKAACEARSGHLVEVDTDEEYSILNAEKERLGLRYLWIGLNDLEADGVWRWSRDRRQAIFSAFGYNQLQYGPQHCVLLDWFNEWIKFDCSKFHKPNENFGAICEM